MGRVEMLAWGSLGEPSQVPQTLGSSGSPQGQIISIPLGFQNLVSLFLLEWALGQVRAVGNLSQRVKLYLHRGEAGSAAEWAARLVWA